MTGHDIPAGNGDDPELAALKSALARATPRPDPDLRAAHLALAQKTFADLQASRDPVRLNPESPRKGLWIGVTDMIARLTSKGALTLTTALVASGVLFLTPAGQDIWRGWQAGGDRNGTAGLTPEAPAPEALTPETPTPEAPTDDTDLTTAQAPTGGEVAQTEAQPLPEAQPQTQAANPSARADLDPAEAGSAPTGLPQVAQAAPGPDAMAQEAEVGADFALGRAVDGGVLTDQSFAAVTAPSPMAPADVLAAPEPNTEAFANADENPLRAVAQEPVSTFSIDVDTASWSVVRQSLNWGQLPPPEAVRVEEMINYFPYDYAAPEGPDAAPFQPNITVMPSPWNPDTQLVSIGIQGEMPAIADRPPLNLVFLIDTSGSMDDPAKLPLLRASFRLMLDQLRPEDRIAIVTYAGSAGLALPPTAASDSADILRALDNLSAGGATAGQAGLVQAYDVARDMMSDGDVTRIILATDGDFNVGLSGTGELTDFIVDQRDSGVFLSVLGFGRGNLDDATMQALAQNGNGTAAYIDTLSEARKVLVDQLTGALFPIASDVKIQVEWNPAVVAEYRLIGYETRALNREDFNNDRVDAGDLGAGHTVTAIYEITPVGSPAVMIDPLRYGEAAAPAEADADAEIGFLRLRWKEPGESRSELLETPILPGGPVSGDARFAAAIAGFGQLLRGSEWLGDWSWQDAIALADENRGADPYGYRAEALGLMLMAAALSDK